VCFKFDSSGCHYPLNLAGNESYERAWCEWVEEAPLICEPEYLSPLISAYWKKCTAGAIAMYIVIPAVIMARLNSPTGV